ncbi:Translation initiation factor IF-2 [Candidatus Xiphinematobacter sp. Idaho Grape]|uniref:translation initiation factor IF-2 n=1 Tax=Candidatus Xiphinematobacter sp. Idaho Grape TaxID=1704307 RepID=UPI0007061E2A|nr:translation initiation factor IF-2 [Candidatus Xiphinematobacter sp. Idaho Grape]ALJ56338.1 Translation initiation factor IF-2 [Candidatus Xiphinematobacter sp. Idaho Grape]
MATRLNSRKGEGGTPTGRGGHRAVCSEAEHTAAPVRPKTDSPVAPSGKATEPLSLIVPERKDTKNAEREKVSKLRPLAPITARTSAASQESKISPSHVEEEGTPAEGNFPASKVLHIKPPIIVRELAEKLGIKPFQIIHDLMKLNIFAAINQTVEPDIASKLCKKHGFHLEREKRKAGEGHRKAVPYSVLTPPIFFTDRASEELRPRAPIITFMGHVDHGKTSLLDAIRKTKVAAGEVGGITQHIGAYSIERDGHRITFLDTPGHAAFTAMRMRGANITDIVVLVVAADDGLMPQTIEAISHARAAGVTVIVAISKVDLPAANIDRVKQQLQGQGFTPEDWGGNTICVSVSATQGTGINELLEMMCLQAEILELKANIRAPARCTVIEAQLEPGRGPTATLIVRAGIIKIGQPFVCGNYWGKLRQLINDDAKPIREAGPSTPVKIFGLSGLPSAGDELIVVDSERSAKAFSKEKLETVRTNKLAVPQRATLENLFQSLAGDQKKSLQVVLKADVQGSMEAIIASLREIPSQKIAVELIHAGVGPISESDVLLAGASNAIIIGFGTKVENSASGIAKREGIQIKLFSIIYELIDQIKEAMVGMLDPQLRETVIGHAKVRQVFELSRGKVAGCVITDGRIIRTARARILRKGQPIYDGSIATLRRFQDDVKEVRIGLECGVKLGDFSEYSLEDTIECYFLEKTQQFLE